MSKTTWWRDPARWLFVAGIIVFGSASSFYPFHGESSQMILQHTGISPFRPSSAVLWGAVASLLRGLPFITLAATLNFFSILCAALCLPLLYRIMHDSHLDTDYDDLSPRFRTMLGLTASLYLMASMPVWLFASRAHPSSFHLLLLLWAVRLIQRFGRRPSVKRLAVIGFLYGLGLVESPLFVASAPVLLPLLLFYLWRSRYLRPRPLLIGGAALLTAFLLYFIPATIFARLPVSEWANLKGPFHLYWILITASPRTVFGLLQGTGWLLMVIVSVTPWVGSLWARSYKPLNENSTGIALSALLMLILGGAMLVLPGIYPNHMTWYSRPFLLPPLLIATSFAMGAVFWCSFFKGYSRRKERTKRNLPRQDRNWSERVVMALVFAMIAASMVINYPHVRPRYNALRYRIARHMVEPLSSGSIVYGGVILTDELQVAAADAGKKINFLHAGLMQSPVQRARMDKLLDNERLSSLLDFSRKAMLREWLIAEPEIADRLVLQVDPEVWATIDSLPVSDRGLYFGVHKDSIPDPDILLAAQQPLWDLLRADLKIDTNIDSQEKYMNLLMAFYFSRSINDMGVLMAFLEKTEQAEECYRLALEFQPSNISAMANLAFLMHQREESYLSLMEQMVQALHSNRAMGLQRILESSGMLQSHDGLAAIQAIWARLPDLSSEEDQLPAEVPAISAQGTTDDALVVETEELAGNQEIPVDPEAETLYTEMIAALAAGELETAKTLGLTLTRRFPQYDIPWILLGNLAFQQGDMETVDASIARMRERDERWLPLMEIAALRYHQKGQLDSAREAYEFILSKQPAHVSSMEGLLRIDLARGGTQRSLPLIRRLLNIDSGNYWANMALGRHHARDEDYAKAVTALRAATLRAPTRVALERLAYVQHMAGQQEDALESIRESLRLADDKPATWHIYGLIVEAQGDLAEAETAYRRVLDIDPRMMENVVQLAELLQAQGRADEAEDLLQQVHDAGMRFSPELRLRAEHILEPARRY